MNYFFRESFTDQVRYRLEDLGLRRGRKVTFRYRRAGKLKKVTDKFVYFSHIPDRGFRIHLTQVKWLGSYFGGFELAFDTHNIVWYVEDKLPKMIEACLDP